MFELVFAACLRGKSIGTSEFCTISNAKKTPLNGALKPADTPAAAPQANSSRSLATFLFTRCISLSSISSKVPNTRETFPNILLFINRRLKLIPASTEGPSGPRLLPVPNVRVAATALREKRAKSLRSDAGVRFTHASNSSGGIAFVALIESKSTSLTVSRNPGGMSPIVSNNPTRIPPNAGINQMGIVSLILKVMVKMSSPLSSFHNAGFKNGNMTPSPYRASRTSSTAVLKTAMFVPVRIPIKAAVERT
mmetsp:Transcript_15734/g.26536  ORF Transcript_15734/g.26536 Transcript_15734/m.26536 type:complete len:251 (-) Transcript_15734:353-1105(-)